LRQASIAFLRVQMGPKGKAFGRPFASLGNIKNSVPARCARTRVMQSRGDARVPFDKGREQLLRGNEAPWPA